MVPDSTAQQPQLQGAASYSNFNPEADLQDAGGGGASASPGFPVGLGLGGAPVPQGIPPGLIQAFQGAVPQSALAQAQTSPQNILASLPKSRSGLIPPPPPYVPPITDVELGQAAQTFTHKFKPVPQQAAVRLRDLDKELTDEKTLRTIAENTRPGLAVEYELAKKRLAHVNVAIDARLQEIINPANNMPRDEAIKRLVGHDMSLQDAAVTYDQANTPLQRGIAQAKTIYGAGQQTVAPLLTRGRSHDDLSGLEKIEYKMFPRTARQFEVGEARIRKTNAEILNRQLPAFERTVVSQEQLADKENKKGSTAQGIPFTGTTRLE